MAKPVSLQQRRRPGHRVLHAAPCRESRGPAGTLRPVPISRQLLDDDEEVLVDVRPHWVFVSGPALLTLLALAGAIAIGVEFPGAPIQVAWVLGAMVGVPALWLVARISRWLGVSIVVTTHRLIYRRGLLRRDVVQLRLQRIVEVHLTQSLLDRLIGAGRLVVEVQGDPQPLFVEDVRRPRSLQRVINEQLDLLDGGSSARWEPTGPSAQWPVAASTRPVPPPGNPHSLETTPPHGIVLGGDPTSSSPGRPVPVTNEIGSVEPPPAGSIPDQLIQLDDLRRRGILTADEFAAKKAELLRRL